MVFHDTLCVPPDLKELMNPIQKHPLSIESYPCQGLTITIKSPYVITYVHQNFDTNDVLGQIPKSIFQASYLLSRDFPMNFSYTYSFINRMKRLLNQQKLISKFHFKKFTP